ILSELPAPSFKCQCSSSPASLDSAIRSGHLLFPPPRFDSFFSLDCIADIRVFLEVDQAIQSILARKAWDRLVPVLVRAPLNVVRYSNVQSPCSARHDLDPVVLHRGIRAKSLRVDPSPREDSGQALPPLTLRLARDDKKEHPECGRAV